MAPWMPPTPQRQVRGRRAGFREALTLGLGLWQPSFLPLTYPAGFSSLPSYKKDPLEITGNGQQGQLGQLERIITSKRVPGPLFLDSPFHHSPQGTGLFLGNWNCSSGLPSL